MLKSVQTDRWPIPVEFDAGHLTWDGTAITNNVLSFVLTDHANGRKFDTTLVRTYTPIGCKPIQDIALSYLQTANNALLQILLFNSLIPTPYYRSLPNMHQSNG